MKTRGQGWCLGGGGRRSKERKGVEGSETRGIGESLNYNKRVDQRESFQINR